MKLPILAAVVLAAAALTACDPGDGTYVAAPPAYGAAGSCYYVDDVAEAIALQAAGLCPVNWVPAPMPMSWRNQNAWYYDSPAYYNQYVPAGRRTTYVTHVKVYERANPAAVRTAPKPAPFTQPKSQSSFKNSGRVAGGDAGTSRTVSTKPASRPFTQQKSSSSFKGSRK